jgi:hypothetical protein
MMNIVKFIITILILLNLSSGISVAGAKVVLPYESPYGFHPTNLIDELVVKSLAEYGIKPANLCSDSVFVRRVYLDVLGTLPTPYDLQRFYQDQRKRKREKLIDLLLERKEFAVYWSLKWCDLLRVKAEFPINLWPNAVQAYHRWIYDSIIENKPYDQFARELLTSSGSNFRVPAVNFYRAIQGKEPSAISSAVALTFMGIRFETLSKTQKANFEKFFTKVGYKRTGEWKEEIVFLDPSALDPIETAFLDGTQVTIAYDRDPRMVFADWLIDGNNPWFAKAIVNRIWFWLMGRGIIHEADDIRDDNPPVHPELLSYLEQELVQSNYDLKHIYRLILNSSIYQQSPIPQSDDPNTENYFAQYPVRRLDAEVLIDALTYLFGGEEKYSSSIPEPFTFIPEEHRTIQLADGSITSSFLEMFGRPPRDTGLLLERNSEPTDAQLMHLLNSTHIQEKIDKSWRVKQIMKAAKKDRTIFVRRIYMCILSRMPLPEEIAVAERYFMNGGVNANQAAADLAWALINSKEFLYRH